MLAIRDDTFDGTYPFAPRYYPLHDFEFLQEDDSEKIVPWIELFCELT